MRRYVLLFTGPFISEQLRLLLWGSNPRAHLLSMVDLLTCRLWRGADL